MKLKQVNKCWKCPNCKNTYLEPITRIEHNGYCNEIAKYLQCNKCFGIFMEIKDKYDAKAHEAFYP